jgi:hypothetical protein
MYHQQSVFRKISAGLQLAAACAMAIALTTAPIASAATCPPLPAGAIYPPSGTMVAWYPFDETASPSIDLATGNTVVWNGAAPVTGEVKGALNFSAGYIDTPDSIVTNFGPGGAATCPSGGDYSTCQGNFSIDVWVNLATVPLSGVNVIVDKRNTSEIGYSFYLYGQAGLDNGNPWMGLQLGDRAHGYTNYGSSAMPTLTAGSWHHVAVTVPRRGTTGILWYLDGSFVTSPTQIPTQTGTLLNNVPLRIGANGPGNGGGSNFMGSLDELQIFNRVLTQQEVTNIYLAGAAGQCKP